MLAMHPYVEERNDTYYVQGQRVRLISLVYDWNNGSNAEVIAENFPVLNLGEVYGAIAFYLEHRAELDVHFAQMIRRESDLKTASQAQRDAKSIELHQRFAALRAQRESPTA